MFSNSGWQTRRGSLPSAFSHALERRRKREYESGIQTAAENGKNGKGHQTGIRAPGVQLGAEPTRENCPRQSSERSRAPSGRPLEWPRSRSCRIRRPAWRRTPGKRQSSILLRSWLASSGFDRDIVFRKLGPYPTIRPSRPRRRSRECGHAGSGARSMARGRSDLMVRHDPLRSSCQDILVRRSRT